MVDVAVSWMAIVASAIASIVIGMLWYGPLFGKQWMAYMGMKEADIKKAKAQGMGAMMPSMALSILGAGVMAYVLTHFHAFAVAAGFAAAGDWMGGAMTGFWAWLGFVATLGLNGVAWEKKPWGLYFLNMASSLVTLLVIGVLVAVW